jgi:hypothetical protein
MDALLWIVKRKGGSRRGARQNLQLSARIAMLTWERIGAEVAELADAQDLGSCGRKAVGVQLPPSAIPLCAIPERVVFAFFKRTWGALRRLGANRIPFGRAPNENLSHLAGR